MSPKLFWPSVFGAIWHTSHGMEEHLLRRQPPQVAVLHEATALRAMVILREMGKAAAPEPEGDPLPLHVLLPHTSCNLRRNADTEWRNVIIPKKKCAPRQNPKIEFGKCLGFLSDPELRDLGEKESTTPKRGKARASLAHGCIQKQKHETPGKCLEGSPLTQRPP